MTSPARTYIVLTKEIRLTHEEAMVALGKRPVCLPEFRGLSRQEQALKVQEYRDYGLTEEEAKRIVGIQDCVARPPAKRPKQQAAAGKSLDWMPAVEA